jgi:hypothetical protein
MTNTIICDFNVTAGREIWAKELLEATAYMMKAMVMECNP